MSLSDGIKQNGIDRPHHNVFEYPHRQKRHKCFSIQHAQPQGSEKHIADDGYGQFCRQHPPKTDRTLIEKTAVKNTAHHGADGETREKGSGRVNDVF